MSTTPNPISTEASAVLTTIDKDLQTGLLSLANKHVAVSYTLIGLLLLVLVGGGLGAYFAAKWVDKEISVAKESDQLMVQYKQQYTAINQAYQVELAQHAADRAADAQKELALLTAIGSINRAANQRIQDVTVPGRSAQDVYADLKAVYKDNPTVSGVALQVSVDPTTKEQLLTFPTTAVQQFSATKIDRDRLNSNAADLSQEVDLLKQDNSTLNQDLAKGQETLAALQKTETQCEKTVVDYKKIVTPSKWKRILSGAAKVGLFIAGGLIGHAL